LTLLTSQFHERPFDSPVARAKPVIELRRDVFMGEEICREGWPDEYATK
jgi:hypothetical protein